MQYWVWREKQYRYTSMVYVLKGGFIDNDKDLKECSETGEVTSGDKASTYGTMTVGICSDSYMSKKDGPSKP